MGFGFSRSVDLPVVCFPGKCDKKSAGDAFEGFCAQLYERMGCKVHRTPSSNDEGRDIELVYPDGKTAIVECKCYAPDRSVGREPVQKLAGANRKCKADRMVFITTGKFLPTARQWVREIEDDLELVDGNQLSRLVEEARQKRRRTSPGEWRLSMEDVASHYPPDLPPCRTYPPVSMWASRDAFWGPFQVGVGLLGVFLALALIVMRFAPLSSAAISLRGLVPACLGALAPSSEYVLPDSDSRYYSREELEALSDWELYVGHNEIYARHGKGFLQDDLAEHFSNAVGTFGSTLPRIRRLALPTQRIRASKFRPHVGGAERTGHLTISRDLTPNLRRRSRRCLGGCGQRARR